MYVNSDSFPLPYASVLKTSISRVPLLLWLSIVLVYLLVPISTLDQFDQTVGVGAVLILLGLISFAICHLTGNGLTNLARARHSRLLPAFPQAHVVAGLVLVFTASLLLPAVFLVSHEQYYLAALSTTFLSAAFGLFITTGNTAARTTLSCFCVGFLGIVANTNFATFVESRLHTVLLSSGARLHATAFGIGLFFLLGWWRGLIGLAAIGGGTAKTVWIRRIVRYFNAVGYLRTPTFLSLERLDQKPIWWWLHVGITNPILYRGSLFYLLCIAIVAMASKDIMGVIAKIAIVGTMLLRGFVLIDAFGQYWNRLYLQSPLSNRQFLTQVSILHGIQFALYYLGGLAFLFLLLGNDGLEEALVLMSLGVIGFALGCCGYLSLNFLKRYASGPLDPVR